MQLPHKSSETISDPSRVTYSSQEGRHSCVCFSPRQWSQFRSFASRGPRTELVVKKIYNHVTSNARASLRACVIDLTTTTILHVRTERGRVYSTFYYCSGQQLTLRLKTVSYLLCFACTCSGRKQVREYELRAIIIAGHVAPERSQFFHQAGSWFDVVVKRSVRALIVTVMPKGSLGRHFKA